MATTQTTYSVVQVGGQAGSMVEPRTFELGAEETMKAELNHKLNYKNNLTRIL